MTLTPGQINHLGERLRVVPSLSDEDLQQLQDIRRDYDFALAVAMDRVTRELPDAHPTSRLKTVQTLIAKLQRAPTMNLSQVQDIAGLRIVRPMDLPEQDELAARIGGLFESAKLVDRRAAPSFGYRAVHLIVRVESRLVEIQLRTTLQDQWAQIVERLADYWGRQIRYGGAPEEPTARVGGVTRAYVVELARRTGPLIAQAEEAAIPAAGPTAGLLLPATNFRVGVETALRQLARLDIVGVSKH